MCTMILERTELTGNAQGGRGWFPVTHAAVTYDHPFSLDVEHALSIDFLNDSTRPGDRIAAELSPDSARRLAEAILAALDRGETYEHANAPLIATGSR